MAKKYTLFIFGIALFFALSVSASMGGNSTGGHMMMGNHHGTMANHTKHMATHSSKGTKVMDSKTAKAMMKMYMDNRSQAGYQLKNFKDDGAYFKADVLSPEGTLLNKLVVNKKNKNTYFTNK